MSAPLWTIDAMAAAMAAGRAGPLPIGASGLSIDSRTIARGEAFFAIAGQNRDGHDFVPAALAAGAGLAVVARNKRGALPENAPLLVVDDVLGGLVALAHVARARASARIVGVTGSVGKTGTKEALRLALSTQGDTHASAASYNNHWGVPLSVARMPATACFGVFELGMNHAGEIAPLTRIVRPHVAIITTVAPVHLEFFASVEEIADAKAEIFLGVERGGAAVINRDNPHFARLCERAGAAGIGRIISFGAHARADARLIDAVPAADGSRVRADILGAVVSYLLGSPGHHLVQNSLAVLAAAALVGVDVATAARALAGLRAAAGRGRRLTLDLPDGTALLIDESYNANPASMRAALALLGEAPVACHGRRIAVLGDMRELGAQGEQLHAELAEPIAQAAIDLVLCCGPQMRALWQELPADRRGVYAESAATLQPHVRAVIRAGDVVMVKGSLGSRMGPIVAALIQEFAREEPAAAAAAQG